MQKTVRLFLFAFLLIGTCIPPLIGASTSNPTRLQPGVHLDDQQIEAAIRTKLAKSKIGKDGFKFKVARGIVTWEGSTLVPQHKGAATRMARTAGAAQVVNNIQVAGGNKPGTPLKKAYVQ